MKKIITPTKSVYQSRKNIGYAPYLPSDLVTYIKAMMAHGKFVQHSDQDSRIHMRYDLDTALCLANIVKMLELVNIPLGIPAKIYIRVDEKSYDPKVCRSILEPMLSSGFEIGLHTTCYVYEHDAIAAFQDETAKFVQAMGFQPKTFTIHGMGQFRLDIRNGFIEKIKGHLAEHGYEHTDCGASDLIYSYSFEDCRLEADTGKHFMFDDFLRPSEFLISGQDALILLHPCYWTVL